MLGTTEKSSVLKFIRGVFSNDAEIRIVVDGVQTEGDVEMVDSDIQMRGGKATGASHMDSEEFVMTPVDADPELQKGKMWTRGDENLVKISADGESEAAVGWTI